MKLDERRKIFKTGGSLAVCIPSTFIKIMGIKEDDYVMLTIDEKKKIAIRMVDE